MPEPNKEKSENYRALTKKGDWEKIVTASEKIESLLSGLKPKEISGNVSDGEFKVLSDNLSSLSNKWKEWRPRKKESYSKEMRDKTAQQTSIDQCSLEKENKDTSSAVKEAGNYIKKAATEIKNGNLKKAGKKISSAAKKTGKALDNELRPEIRKIEKATYKAVLKVNSLYFNTDLLGAVLSKPKISFSNVFELDIYVKNPYLRKKIEEKVDWNA